MMDTKVWNGYAGDKAKYAMGGPTIEMFCTSYKETHEESSIDCYVNSAVGYTFKDEKHLLSDYNKIYIKIETDKDYGMWLASPSNEYSNSVVSAYYAGHLTYLYYGYDGYGSGIGLCPIVCLKSGIQLEKKSDGVYSIK